MSKKLLLLYALLIFSLITNCSSENEEENKEENKTEEVDENNTFPEFEEEDPFKDLNFTNVITLKESTFTDELASHDEIFLLFYTNWCHNCHKFMPVLVETADYCKEHNIPVTFMRFNGDGFFNSTEEFDLTSFHQCTIY